MNLETLIDAIYSLQKEAQGGTRGPEDPISTGRRTTAGGFASSQGDGAPMPIKVPRVKATPQGPKVPPKPPAPTTLRGPAPMMGARRKGAVL